MNRTLEQKNSNLFSIGLATITIIIFTKNISDPVNAPKLLALGLTSALVLSNLVFPNLKYLFKNFRTLALTSILTLLIMLISSLASESPFSQNWYGVQGRNTGFLAHLGFLILMIALLALKELRSIDKILTALGIAGITNIVYCLWVVIFGDFIGWNNPYKSLLGTFGNPNFISSFLGISVSLFVSLLFSKNRTIIQYSLICILILLSIYEIYRTNSIQGFILVSLGLFINIFYFVHTKFRNRFISFLYLSIGILFSILGFLGINGKGPLSSILFQDTFVFRKQYWLAGLQMGITHPLTGVGMDSYGDWYRQMRTATSAVTPGLDVVTNVAHNIYIDAFANGGFIFLLCYLIPTSYAFLAILKISRSMIEFEFRFVALVSMWFCYQIQSLISISQIGLSIWGWVFSGLLIVYPKLISKKDTVNNSILEKNRLKNSSFILRLPIMIVSISIAFVLYSPPLLADYKWTKAYISRDATKIYDSLRPTYFAPSNSFRLAQAAQIFEASNLNDQAHSIAVSATIFNPRNFDGWQLLYFVKKSNSDEKLLAKNMMIKMDPLNPKWQGLK